MSWYRVYRPQTIHELHLPSVREALDRIRQSGTYSHAYLLTGPKGTGKTSSARIIAKMVNCEKNAEHIKASSKKPFVEPCGTCPSCERITRGSSMCVVEMDAASNRGIDDIRMLRERVNLAPSDGLVNVYIIDEVHMLTTEAFNALLKVLEEPPKHVIFILATTEFHKVPETIISRCTVIQFRKASLEDIEHALRTIAKKETIAINSSLLTQIAQKADGSFRDAVKMFEHLAQGKTSITNEDVALFSDEGIRVELRALCDALFSRDAERVAKIFVRIEEKNIDPTYAQKITLQMLHEYLVAEIMNETQNGKAAQVQSLLSHLAVPLDPLQPFPSLPFELACFSWCFGEVRYVENTQDSIPIPQKSSQIHIAEDQTKRTQSEAQASLVQDDHRGEEQTDELIITSEEILVRWQDILAKIKSTNATVEALLRAARPQNIQGKVVTIEVFYPFHKEQLELEKHRKVIEDVIKQAFSLPVLRVSYVLGKKENKPRTQKAKDEDLIQSASEALLS